MVQCEAQNSITRSLEDGCSQDKRENLHIVRTHSRDDTRFVYAMALASSEEISERRAVQMLAYCRSVGSIFWPRMVPCSIGAEMNQPLSEQLHELISQGKWAEAAAWLQQVDLRTAAENLLSLPFEQQRAMFRQLRMDFAAALLPTTRARTGR